MDIDPDTAAIINAIVAGVAEATTAEANGPEPDGGPHHYG